MELSEKTDLPLIFDTPPAFRPLSRLAGGSIADFCGVFNILGVLSGGEYALCGIGRHFPELIFGKAGEDRLADVWENHPRLKELREGMPDRLEGVCARCLMKHLCLGSCVAQNFFLSSSFWAPYWFCREAAEAGVFPGSRLAAGCSR